VFAKSAHIALEDFMVFNQAITSEMFLSIMLLLQSSMPCSSNFNRYKEKFQQFLEENPHEDDQPRN
jgi:hypothetical protein